MSINISDYNRSGVFIEERNNSVIDRAPATDALLHFVPGFSKKGTVFNRPVLISNTTDRAKYFGDIDRSLEKKGSFFHRTIDIALQTAPVLAMNLLKTNSLDTLNYASVSLSAQYDNDPIAYEQYDSFFNKAGFWQRDTESFLTFARNSERMIHFTNVSDKKITLFMFKSDKTSGYNVTAESWYGGKDKVPTWMNANDLISDYLVRLIIVSGDWSNYTQLAVDSTWSKYFNASGLRKSAINNFVNDTKVTILGDYNASLIPYFQDKSGNNIFIEGIVNLNTDKTGLFCAFDIDNVETDFANGNIDIIGQTLAGLDKSKINFMSYVDTIEEVDNYTETVLDRPGNIVSIFDTSLNGYGSISTMYNTYNADFQNNRVNIPVFTTTLNANDPFVIPNGTAIIANNLVEFTTTTLNFDDLALPSSGTTTYRIDTIYVEADGIIQYGKGIEYPSQSIAPADNFFTEFTDSAIIIGYFKRQRNSSGNYTNTYYGVQHDGTTEIQALDENYNSLITTTQSTSYDLTITFNNTSSVTKSEYHTWCAYRLFKDIITKKSTNSIFIANSMILKISDCLWLDNYTSTTGDKYITVTDLTQTVGFSVGAFMMCKTNDEFYLGDKGISSVIPTVPTSSPYSTGICGPNSEMYLDFYNGMINTGDYFYINIGYDSGYVTFKPKFENVAGVNYMYLDHTGVNNDANNFGLSTGATNTKIIIDGHSVNNGTFTITNVINDSFNSRYKYELVENVINYLPTTAESIEILNANWKVYLKMYFTGSDFKCDFMADNTLMTPATISGITGLGGPATGLYTNIKVYSGEASYEQSLEIETHAAYTMTDNKFLIDLTRYPEVKVGDYVKAYYDESLLQPSEYPKKFARILKKLPWTGNATYGVQYAEITTDIKIDVASYGTDLQTTRYTTVEDYIDTYKAISLSGFAVQSTSIPDGSEVKQAEILNVIGKGTSLYDALINKNTFNFRYLIDSFGLGLTEFSKQQLADITGKRKNAISILNMPSAKDFKKSSSPYFLNTDGTLNTLSVKTGGDLEQNPAFLYSLAQGSGKDDGRDTSGYFFPYVTIGDNGRPLSFPPAAYVANTYMRKNNSNVGGVYNWTVAAGVEDGKILGIAGTEMPFTEKDLENFFAMGINPINYSKNNGYYIETEFTASTEDLSSLSFLHSREVLIDLENELYAMLIKYNWKFNTPAVRAKIKREADAICQKYVDQNALYAFENIIDETNNTNELIDNQFGLLETYIEITKAMGTIVNVVNVMATGALGSSTGFGA